MPQLFAQIIDGCRNRNEMAIRTALESLIRSGYSAGISGASVTLYQLCLLHLKLNKIDDIRKVFERLVDGYNAALLTLAVKYQERLKADIEVERISESSVNLRTSEQIIANQLISARGVHLDIIEQLPTGEKVWLFHTDGRGLEKKLERLRRPSYLNFLERNESRQLSLEF